MPGIARTTPYRASEPRPRRSCRTTRGSGGSVPILADRVKIDFRPLSCQHTSMPPHPVSRRRTLWLGAAARAEFAAAADVIVRETDCTVRSVEAQSMPADGLFEVIVSAE